MTDLEQMLVFVTDVTGTRDIWAVDADGAVKGLTNGDADDGSPSFCCTPSGEHAMAFDRRDGINRDIYAMHLGLGSAPCPLTTDPAPDSNPDWSPDGKHVAFERDAGGETQIWVMEVNVVPGVCPSKVGQERQVTANQPPSFEPSWYEWTSPQNDVETRGHRIAFSGPEDATDRNIHYVEQRYDGFPGPATPFDGTAHVQSATPFDEPSEERGPSWSPRGDGLIFASNRGGGDYDVYFLDEAADTPVLLVGAPDTDTDDLNPAIQPLPVTDSVKASGSATAPAGRGAEPNRARHRRRPPAPQPPSRLGRR